MACEMAAMWSSLNEASNAEPRWPDVPNATRCAATEEIWVEVVKGGDETRNIHKRVGSGVLAWLIRHGCENL